MEFDTISTVFEEGCAERGWDTDTDGSVRLALVGLGNFSRREALPAIEECTYAEVTAVVSGSAEKAREVALEADAALTYEEFRDGEATDAYDAVYVCTPNAHHLEHVETAAALGKHVICEKPMEASLERAEALVSACRRGGVTLMVAYRLQVDPVIRRVRDLVTDGFVGEVAQVVGSFSFTMFGESNPDANQWRLDPTLAGGGSLYDIGIYPLNTTRFVLDADPESIHASLTSPHDEFEGPVIDEHAAFVVEFPGGVQAICRSSYGSFGENRLVVTGDDGRITVENSFDHGPPRTVVLERGGHTVRYEGCSVNELTEQFEYFAHCCLNDETPRANGEHGLVDMRALAGAQTSAMEGRRVDLD